MYNVSDTHGERLPFVRIKKIQLKNIKGVVQGTIEMNCAKEFVPYDTKSDILGLYGQNGSGKSSLVEALSMVKGIVSGYRLSDGWVSLIDVASDSAIISILFDFQYKDGTCIDVEYNVKVVRQKRKKTDFEDDIADDEVEDKKYKIGIEDEIIKTNVHTSGKIGRMHPIVDTKNNLFCATSLEKEYYNKKDGAIENELIYLKRKCFEDSKSFVFSEEVATILEKKEEKSKYYELLVEIDLFVSAFLYVVSNRTSGLVQLKAGMPIYIPFLDKPIVLKDEKPVSVKTFDYIKETFSRINIVLETIIPNLQLELVGKSVILNNGEEGIIPKIFSIRGDRRFPFVNESEGIIKIVSVLADYIFAFKQGSTTLVVDEFDSGIFEFLLGELLQIFESDGKGQFIFTSHNLRPLEVIDKKYIRFTTSNPENRYYKLKNIGKSNNLRDLYLREVQLGKQDVEMYKRTKAFKIIKALRKAGEENALDG